MPAYRGKNVQVLFGGVDVSGDGRSVSFEESADALDSTTYGDTAREKVPGLLDSSGSLEAIDTTGAWSTAWQAIDPGTSGTLVVYPEGNTAGNRRISCTAIVTGRSLTVPYDDIANFTMSFEVSGAVTQDVVAP